MDCEQPCREYIWFSFNICERKILNWELSQYLTNTIRQPCFKIFHTFIPDMSAVFLVCLNGVCYWTNWTNVFMLILYDMHIIFIYVVSEDSEFHNIWGCPIKRHIILSVFERFEKNVLRSSQSFFCVDLSHIKTKLILTKYVEVKGVWILLHGTTWFLLQK